MTGAKLSPRTISARMGNGAKLTATISVEGRSHAEKPTYSGAFDGLLDRRPAPIRLMPTMHIIRRTISSRPTPRPRRMPKGGSVLTAVRIVASMVNTCGRRIMTARTD